MEIGIRHLFVINLDDDDEIIKFDEEVHNELNLLFFSPINLNGSNHDDPSKKSVSLVDYHSMALVSPLDIYLPFIYNEKYLDANDPL
jgi:hypothetical protein